MKRRWSVVLLAAVLRLCPPDAKDWGQGMLAELEFIENPWAALCWALGSAQVILIRAASTACFRTEAVMKRPRIVFSFGMAFLIVAMLVFAFAGLRAYQFLRNYERVEATVVSEQTSAKETNGGKVVYITNLAMEYEEQQGRKTAPAVMMTTDAQEHERWAHEYAVGTHHLVHLVRRNLQPGEIGHRVPVTLETNDPLPRLVTVTLLASLGAVLLTVGMVYVGRKRKITYSEVVG